MVLSGVNVVHDSLVGGQDDVAELSGGEEMVHELLEVLDLEVEPGGDNSALVESSVKVNDDLATSLIVNDLELIDISMLLHDSKELDDNLRDWSQENLNLQIVINNHEK